MKVRRSAVKALPQTFFAKEYANRRSNFRCQQSTYQRAEIRPLFAAV